MVCLHLLIAVAYFTWRITGTLGEGTQVYPILFLLAELGMLSFTVPLYVNLLGGARSGPVPEPPVGLTVDVLIPTYNEELHLVRATAVAARSLEYPHETWILDDGRREEMRRLAEELGVGYLTRPDNTHYKAGNLNSALAQTSGDVVLILDADHVVRPQLLTRLLGYFSDPSVALVQIPQLYYNLESFQHAVGGRVRQMWHESSLFHHVIQTRSDRWNTAFFIGTGGLIRRSALEEVGGIATGSITEDIYTSMRLHALGYKSVFIDEALGYMLAPETPLAYAVQRMRWARGSMQILRMENPLWKKGLGAWQRVSYFGALSGWLNAYPRLVCFLAPGLYLLFGLAPIHADPNIAVPVLAAKVALDVTMIRLVAYPHYRMFMGECFNLVNTPIGLYASLALLSPKGLVFEVTPKGRQHGLPSTIIVPIVAIGAFNLVSLGAGVWGLSQGLLHPVAGAFTILFCVWFSAVALYTLLYAYQRRASDEAYTFPVQLPAHGTAETGERTPVDIVRLNSDLAYVRTMHRWEPGDVVCLEDDQDIGLCVDGRVIDVVSDPEQPSGWLAKLSFAEQMVGRERDALDGYLFDSVLPAFLSVLPGAPATPPPEHEVAIRVDGAYAGVARLTTSTEAR